MWSIFIRIVYTNGKQYGSVEQLRSAIERAVFEVDIRHHKILNLQKSVNYGNNAELRSLADSKQRFICLIRDQKKINYNFYLCTS